MASEHKLIRILSPSLEISETFENYKKVIMSVLPDANVRLIGSFAVPMKGKEEIDLLIETENVESAQEKLAIHGFNKGPIVDGQGFMHSRLHPIMCEAHILRYGDKRVTQYLSLIRKLQENTPLRTEYEKLKESFNGKPSGEYKLAKKKFLKDNELV